MSNMRKSGGSPQGDKSIGDGMDPRNSGTGRGKIGGKSVDGAPGSTIVGPAMKWDPQSIPARAARGEADSSVSLGGLNPSGSAK